MLDSRRTPAALMARFEHFGEESAASSPLYSFLSGQISKSDWMLALLSNARPDQPAPNLLFGAVHFLLKVNPTHALANFYPSLSESPQFYKKSFLPFLDFCQEFEAAIQEMLKNKRVQTNEVARSAILMPAIAYVSSHFKGQALSIVDVGASAGLNLLWDRFSYLYENEKGQQIFIGPQASKLQLHTTLQGKLAPGLPKIFPAIHHRVGIDLNPLGPINKEDQAWLYALIWPEYNNRRQNLKAAINIWKKHPQEVIKGNAVKRLPEIALMSPQESPLLILSSLTLYQFSSDEKHAWAETLSSISQKRPLVQISLDLVGKTTVALRLQIYHLGDFHEIHLANTEGHARTIEWLLP